MVSKWKVGRMMLQPIRNYHKIMHTDDKPCNQRNVNELSQNMSSKL